VRAPAPGEPEGALSGDPAGIVRFRGGRLEPSDPDGFVVDWAGDAPLDRLAPNHRLVIYELPTRWCTTGTDGQRAVGTGTFDDARALVQPNAVARHFPDVHALEAGRAHLQDLGVNALELLPPADSDDVLSWGYGTANYCAGDFHLGGGDDGPPRANRSLAALVTACHLNGVRFFTDMVMAFARSSPYHNVNFHDFFVRWRPHGDPERDPEQQDRDGFGGDLLKYNLWVDGYHPETGRRGRFVPAREYMKLQAAHWLDHFRVDGLRLDSVNNTGSWDFLREFKDASRRHWKASERATGLGPAVTDPRFLVVGEDLHVPVALVTERRLDGLWNERFKQLARQVLLGRPASGMSFEESVRTMVDGRRLGFADGSEMVNYLTSHDVGGLGNERLFDYLAANGVHDAERRMKLAFACLLTAVGIPMILAGDEFADQHDLDILHEHSGAKQVDPVNWSRLEDDWRRRLFDYVARLVRLRTTAPALGANETEFLHADLTDGRRVLAWQRGRGDEAVVVVANFSDWASSGSGAEGPEYVIPRFPPAPAGRTWREVTQDRPVPEDWAGREPLFPWEAKVYALGP
jgi:pullulanase/glycogen debranching enzyme